MNNEHTIEIKSTNASFKYSVFNELVKSIDINKIDTVIIDCDNVDILENVFSIFKTNDNKLEMRFPNLTHIIVMQNWYLVKRILFAVAAKDNPDLFKGIKTISIKDKSQNPISRVFEQQYELSEVEKNIEFKFDPIQDDVVYDIGPMIIYALKCSGKNAIAVQKKLEPIAPDVKLIKISHSNCDDEEKEKETQIVKKFFNNANVALR